MNLPAEPGVYLFVIIDYWPFSLSRGGYSKLPKMNKPTPTQMAESATLKAGQWWVPT